MVPGVDYATDGGDSVPSSGETPRRTPGWAGLARAEGERLEVLRRSPVTATNPSEDEATRDGNPDRRRCTEQLKFGEGTGTAKAVTVRRIGQWLHTVAASGKTMRYPPKMTTRLETFSFLTCERSGELMTIGTGSMGILPTRPATSELVPP